MFTWKQAIPAYIFENASSAQKDAQWAQWFSSISWQENGAPIVAGVLSFGMSGKIFHCPFLEEHPGFRLKGIVERTKNEAAIPYPNAVIYRSVEALIQDPEIELVVVNTPVQTHFEFTKMALEAGKHVVLEKPMTVSLEEAETLAKLATSLNLQLIVYQNRRYDGDFLFVKEVVESGVLGQLFEVEFAYNRFRPAPAGKAHKEGGLPGAGIMHDLGAHLIDQAIQLFGMPNAVFADADVFRAGVEANDYFELLLLYPNKLRVRLKSNMLVRELQPAYQLHGALGSLLQERSDRQEEALANQQRPSLKPWCAPAVQADALLHTETEGQLTRDNWFTKPGNYMGFFNDVYDVLRNNKINPIPGSDGVNIMKVLDAAYTSIKMGKVITIL